ncbi:MAG: FAD-dependent oxidoreductase [Desulfobacteraceae bacterium]|nr:FAD-dependent oxidoreductase [Desulfobacteraceae bacterium]
MAVNRKLRIAVVGGGVAGITAAYLLQHSHHVTLFEKNPYIGGHTHTVVIPEGPDAGTPVDTGFIVLNDRTYPVLNRLFRRLGVAIRKSDMSFSYFCEKTGFQYASRNLDSLFARRANLADPRHWSLLTEILIFNRTVHRKLQRNQLDGMTLGRFLRRFRFSSWFRERYLFPMVAAIWSAPEMDVDRFPMLTFARFFDNHGLLTLRGHPQWYYVAGGSHSYVRAFLAQFTGEVQRGAAITAVRREPDGVVLHESGGRTRKFDRVIIAAHADEALALLSDPTDDERRLLGAWRYSANRTYLHTDTRWMPTNPRAWASWNFIRPAQAAAPGPVTLTYHMNRLQQLHTRNHYLVTLNPPEPIDDDNVIAEMTYTHPVFTFESIGTQKDLSRLNGVQNTYFCGSYFRYGFHEDAARSGALAAAAVGTEDEL